MKKDTLFKASLVDGSLVIALNKDVEDCLTESQIEEVTDGIGNLASFVCSTIVENNIKNKSK